MYIDLTNNDKKVIAQTAYGCDIFCKVLAKRAISLEKRYPDLIRVTKPMGEYPQEQSQPIIGAIASADARACIGLPRKLILK